MKYSLYVYNGKKICRSYWQHDRAVMLLDSDSRAFTLMELEREQVDALVEKGLCVFARHKSVSFRDVSAVLGAGLSFGFMPWRDWLAYKKGFGSV